MVLPLEGGSCSVRFGGGGEVVSAGFLLHAACAWQLLCTACGGGIVVTVA